MNLAMVSSDFLRLRAVSSGLEGLTNSNIRLINTGRDHFWLPGAKLKSSVKQRRRTFAYRKMKTVENLSFEDAMKLGVILIDRSCCAKSFSVLIANQGVTFES